MSPEHLTIAGVIVAAVAVVGVIVSLYGKSRRGAGKTAAAAGFAAVGIGIGGWCLAVAAGINTLIPTVIAVLLTVTAVTFAVLRGRELTAARRRDLEFGTPPQVRPRSGVLVFVTALIVGLGLAAAIAVPWMLHAAADAGVPETDIIPGLVGNTTIPAVILATFTTVIVVSRSRRRVHDAALLQQGLAYRDAATLNEGYRHGYQVGVSQGREEGYNKAAFGQDHQEGTL